MADNQQKYKLEVQQQEREIKSALTQLNAIYKQLKINLSVLSILALFYLTISLFVIKTYSNINIYIYMCMLSFNRDIVRTYLRYKSKMCY